ncbi:MAG: polysaccharide deacetylase family protein [bacterium]|nr:polysaccharide deacetylase family protein [bacterium]
MNRVFRSKFKFQSLFFYLLLWGIIASSATAQNSVLYVRPANSADYFEKTYQLQRYYTPKNVYLDDLLSNTRYIAQFASDKNFPTTLEGYSFVILPDIVCLSRSHFHKITDYVKKGGGLFITGGLGSRTESGEFQGYGLLRELLSVEPREASGKLEDLNALQLRYGYAGSLAAPPGYYLLVAPSFQPLCVPASANLEVVGYWSEADYDEVDPATIKREAGLVIREFPSGGRIVWVGTDLEDLVRNSSTRPFYRPIVRQLFEWVAGEAVAGIEPWPERYRNAVLIHGDIETNFEKVVNVIDPFTKYKVKTTFNLLMNQAERYPDILKRLGATGGELSSHAYEHDHFLYQPYDVQYNRIQRFLEVSKKYGFKPMGLRPPYLSFDENTIEAAIQNNLLYITSDRYPISAYPRVVHSKNDSTKKLVLFSKNELDDYDLFEKLAVKNPNDIRRMVLEDYQRVSDMRGLYSFNYHSQFLAHPELVVAAEALLSTVTPQKEVWIATASQIAEWILQRDALQVDIASNYGRLTVSIVNTGIPMTSQAYVRVIPPAYKMRAGYTGSAMRGNVMVENGLVKVPKLKTGERFSIEIAPSQFTTSSLR